MKKIIFFVVIALMLLITTTVGCVDFKTTDEAEAEQGAEKMTFLYEENGIQVYHDNIQNATCWKYDATTAGGISCTPDWMLVPQNMSNNCNCD